MSTIGSAADVGRLLAFALDVAASPGDGGDASDYTRLIRRYLEDAPFRTLFDGLAEGLGCEIATADLHVGVVLRTRPEGPLAWPARASDLPWNTSFEAPSERASRALVVIALLAFVTPSAADLDDILLDATIVIPTVGVRELERFIRDFCEQREASVSDPTGAEDARPLWWHWLQLPADAPTPKRIARGTTTYVVHQVLSFLRGAGLMIDTTPNSVAADKHYRPRRRLLYHYRDLLLDDVYVALRTYATETNTTTAHTDASPSDRPQAAADGGADGRNARDGKTARGARKARR